MVDTIHSPLIDSVILNRHQWVSPVRNLGQMYPQMYHPCPTIRLNTRDPAGLRKVMVRLRSVYTTVLACISQGFRQLVSGLATQNVSPIVSPQLPKQRRLGSLPANNTQGGNIYLWGSEGRACAIGGVGLCC